MALRPAEHFTEFNVAMWSLHFNHVTVKRFEQRNKVLLCTGRIDCKYKNKTSKENDLSKNYNNRPLLKSMNTENLC